MSHQCICPCCSDERASALPGGPTDVVPSHPVRFLRLPDVLALTGIKSKSGLYAKIKEGDFPRGRRISHKMTIWTEADIARWQWHQMRAEYPKTS